MTKKILHSVIIWLLRFEARLVLWRYKPRIVGITGSIGKTSTKDAIYILLNENFSTWRSAKSYNSEIGIPLSILGRPNSWHHPIGWLETLLSGLKLFLFRQDYPKWLVLEIGVDRPGDIKRLTKWLMLDVAVLTNLPDVPSHIEFFASPEEWREEKLSIFKMLKPEGWAVVNGDDKKFTLSEERHVFKYGFHEGNDLRAISEHPYYELAKPMGYVLKLDHEGRVMPWRLPGVVGRHQIYAPLAALAVGLILKLNLVKLADNLALNFLTPPGRLRLLHGVKGSLILDDSYNSSPEAASLALKTLKELEVEGKKVAVLGDMLELGAYTIDAHKKLGEAVKEVVEVLFTVGVRAKFIGEAAVEVGFDKKAWRHFDLAQDAARKLEHVLEVGDIVLIKGSQSVRLEKVVEEVMLEPAKKDELLCRQEPEWRKR